MKFLKDNDLVLRLKGIVKRQKIVHAYLFYGEDFVLKREIAKFFAKEILCVGEGEFCKSCSSCKKFLSGNHPDFYEIGQKDQKGQSFTVSDVREIIKNAYIKPNESTYKIFLLNDVDSLLKSSLNALLKILESPPKNVVFILTASNKNSVLKTVFSRCVDFFVPICSREDCVKYVEEKKFKTKDRNMEDILDLSEGRLDLLEQYLTSKEAEDAMSISFELLDSFLKGEEFRFMSILQKLENKLLFLFFVFSFFLARVQIYLKELKDFEFEEFEKIYRVVDVLQDITENLKNNANLPLSLSSLCCRIF